MAREPWYARYLIRIAPLLALGLLLASPAHAQNGWELCNQTSFIIEAATGRPEGRTVVMEGWTRLRPGECKVALPAPLKAGVNFVFARSSKAHRGGQRVWNGDISLCVDPNGSFAVENPPSCSAMGLEARNFRAVRIDRRSGWRTFFNEAEPFNKPGQSARGAGLQRLLADAGIDSEPVNGFLGRKSRTAITSFLTSRRLDPRMPDAQLIDVLEEAARNRSLEVGMMLCNRTDKRIWSAIARRNSEGLESRGWWALEAGTCARTVDESLLAEPHYVYAEMEAPQGVRRLTGAARTFCTARSKFAVVGAERCVERGYRQARFLETPSPEDGKLVFEFFERSFGSVEASVR
jgi:uncharacterized membrane protein